MRPMLLSFVLLGLFLDGVLAQEAHRQSLLEARKAWGQAIAEGDVEKIFSFWTDDVVIYPVSEPAVRGIDAVREYVRRNRQERGLKPRITPITIDASASGDFGYTIGTHEWIDREGRATMPGRYVTLWRKDDQGAWRCFLEIHSPRPDADGARTQTLPGSTGNSASASTRRAPVAGTFAPKGPPQQAPMRVAAGESCIVDLTQVYDVTGGLSGSFEIDYRILVKGPCGSPIGTFDEEWIAHGDFKGEFNAKPVAGKLSYVASVKAGGDVEGRLTIGQGIDAELRVFGDFGDGKLSYEGWVSQQREAVRFETPRIQPLEEGEGTPAQRAYLESHERAGRLFNVFKTGARHPDLAKSFDAFAFGHINGETSTLSLRDRELLVLRIGWLCRCEYEWAQHSRIARSIGFTDDELARIIDGPDAEGWSPLEAALLRAADELLRDAFISDATWRALGQEYSEQQLMDIVATVGTYNLACMMLNSWGVQLDEGLTGFPTRSEQQRD